MLGKQEMENEPDTEVMLRNAFDPSKASEDYYNLFGNPASTDYVFYKDTTKPVTFLPELVVDDDVDMTSVFEFELSDLPAGRYRLEETLPPAGYLIQTKFVYFRIKPDRTVVLTKEDDTEGNDNSQASLSLNEGVYTITVKNTPGAALPNTGGPGTRLFTILGSILILGAGLLLWRRRRYI